MRDFRVGDVAKSCKCPDDTCNKITTSPEQSFNFWFCDHCGNRWQLDERTVLTFREVDA